MGGEGGSRPCGSSWEPKASTFVHPTFPRPLLPPSGHRGVVLWLLLLCPLLRRGSGQLSSQDIALSKSQGSSHPSSCCLQSWPAWSRVWGADGPGLAWPVRSSCLPPGGPVESTPPNQPQVWVSGPGFQVPTFPAPSLGSRHRVSAASCSDHLWVPPNHVSPVTPVFC